MTRTISLVVAVVAAGLVAVPVAASQSPDALERAVVARELSSRSGPVVVADAFERAVQAQQSSGSPGDRSLGMNRVYGLGEFAGPKDAFERAAAAQTRGIEQILTARGEGNGKRYWLDANAPGDRSIGLNRLYGLGDFASLHIRDTHDRVTPVSRPTSTPTVTSGRDVDWPQLGIGFFVGILLAAGLLIAVRTARVRPLAH